MVGSDRGQRFLERLADEYPFIDTASNGWPGAYRLTVSWYSAITGFWVRNQGSTLETITVPSMFGSSLKAVLAWMVVTTSVGR